VLRGQQAQPAKAVSERRKENNPLMANPILSRPDAFTRTQPQWQPVPGLQPDPRAQTPVGRMTIEDVISKTAVTMLVLVAAAAATFTVVNPFDTSARTALIGSSIVGFITVLLVSMRRVVNPAAVLFYAVVEGVFIGAFSKMFEVQFEGIVQQAVLGTFAAAGATLAAYRYFNIRVTPKFRRMVFIGTAAFAGVMLVNFVLALMGIDTGLRGMGGLGLVAALLGVGLGVSNLVVDFDSIERGIAGGAPASESWRAAFGITVTMVWLYTEILRLLSFFRRD